MSWEITKITHKNSRLTQTCCSPASALLTGHDHITTIDIACDKIVFCEKFLHVITDTCTASLLHKVRQPIPRMRCALERSQTHLHTTPFIHNSAPLSLAFRELHLNIIRSHNGKAYVCIWKACDITIILIPVIIPSKDDFLRIFLPPLGTPVICPEFHPLCQVLCCHFSYILCSNLRVVPFDSLKFSVHMYIYGVYAPVLCVMRQLILYSDTLEFGRHFRLRAG